MLRVTLALAVVADGLIRWIIQADHPGRDHLRDADRKLRAVVIRR